MATYVEIDDTEVAPEAPITTSLMTRLRDNALSYWGAESGQRTFIQKATSPLGWTMDATQTDKAIKITTGAVTPGGSVAFSTVFGRTATDPMTLSQANLPNVDLSGSTLAVVPTVVTNVTLSKSNANVQAHFSGAVLSALLDGSDVSVSTDTSADVTGNVPLGGSDTPFSANIDMRVQFVGAHIAQKD